MSFVNPLPPRISWALTGSIDGLADGCGDYIMNPTSDEKMKLDVVLKVIADTQESAG